MSEQVNIWNIGNTGLRSPERVWEGLRLFAESPFNGNLRGENEARFQTLLKNAGIIHPTGEAKDTSSYARKWRLAFGKFGFIYPKLPQSKSEGVGHKQLDLGPLDEVTPFGETFLKATSLASQQECFLRSLSVAQYEVPYHDGLFSPLRWILAVMLRLEERTGSSELTRIEFIMWGQTTDPSYNVDEVVDNILDLRARRLKSSAKRKFDRLEIEKRAEHYPKQKQNFGDYGDMNMRYLRVGGVVQRKGRGIVISEAKHEMAEELASSAFAYQPMLEMYRELCNGAPLPSDNRDVALRLLNNMKALLRKNNISFDLSEFSLDTVAEINIARQHLEEAWQNTREEQYAADQVNQWEEIRDYMDLILKGGGTHTYDKDDDTGIEVPKSELPAYLEWVMWRAALAIGHLINKSNDVRRFHIGPDFLPTNTAGGGQGDLYCDYADCTILTEVTMSSSSRQEAMEGEPVRRHVSNALETYGKGIKPVYGLFIAKNIDTNTAETFRHGVWYARDPETQEEIKQRLTIIPIRLLDFRMFFENLFEHNIGDKHAMLRKMIELGAADRDVLGAPQWKAVISEIVLSTFASEEDS